MLEESKMGRMVRVTLVVFAMFRLEWRGSFNFFCSLFFVR